VYKSIEFGYTFTELMIGQSVDAVSRGTR